MGPMKSHLDSFNVISDESMITIIGMSQNLPILLTLEALFREINYLLLT